MKIGNITFGNPKPEDLRLDLMPKSFTLTYGIMQQLTKDSCAITILVNNGALDRQRALGKLSNSEVEQLKAIRESLNDSKAFVTILDDILKQERLNPKQIGDTVTLYWYYERMLLEQGMRKYSKEVDKLRI